MVHTVSPIRSFDDVDGVSRAIADLSWSPADTTSRLGLEIEAFPIVTTAGRPAGRLPLSDAVDTVDNTPGFTRLSDRPSHRAPGRGTITFEPGGQLEHSTNPVETTSELRSQIDAVWGPLREAFAEQGTALVPLGLDPWHDTDAVPQQLPQQRYRAMDAYLARIGPHGATMMRNTSSIQVNVDIGEGSTAQTRWVTANLLAPIITATFASSPSPQARSTRAWIWQRLDPTRTGMPAWDDIDSVDPIDDIVRQVLKADVMYLDRPDAPSLEPGWSFADWVRSGHPEMGRPTTTDLEVHISTLFPEVRPRGGHLEIRGIDGIPARWWSVPLVLTASILYNDQAADSAIEILEPIADDLDATWRRAARRGLDDPTVGPMAAGIARLAVEAASRQPDRFGADDVATAEDYLDRYTLRGRSPADDLRRLLDNPAAALVWATGDES